MRVARGVALLRHGDFDLARAVLEDTAARPDGRTLAAVHADCLAHLALTDAVEGLPDASGAHGHRIADRPDTAHIAVRRARRRAHRTRAGGPRPLRPGHGV
ncbi:hypothetical protein SZMC14600_00100, partial [Saccharomonospora azurea SZMC 14600]|uniref:hypothetical protein n=1 Tax=Saccharomonospora azurea TaxID=40988 RepID=UPI00023FFB7B